ncbi:BolA/IbaG family iron-sulfur metabolism protein [Litorivicinus sp.]|jgi:acid stress-induced BolA-like protein IbaG/YrbA|nr:BolA/IbaG family iron-sulfur metabolism protein [Litorivicinus sp.]MDC1208096.1 BolA/IbaG family iron-sulfur metabolism protein [Litorivicinus sp.]MDC1466152.1 BolA/IbaG family iron-sulfur metabolism protein [Litorivicinus sp.]|tara:strand:- start:14540 stop:14791 length:252 start_codon:yes stop_codon:yes gene_type:complete
MLDTEIKLMLEMRAPQWAFEISGEGRNFTIEVVSDDFEGLTRVKRQQAVYRLMTDEISDGTLHAITITALTAAEKLKRKGLGI